MFIENFLKQFWRCTEVKSTGEDEDLRQVYRFDEKVCGKHLILSGLHFDYDLDEPNAPASLVFNVWDMSGEELIMDYYQTGYVKELQPIKNGFIAITGNDDKGSTAYTFKKTKVNPFKKAKTKDCQLKSPDLIYGIYTIDEWNSMSEEEQIAIQNKLEYDLQHPDQKEWLIQ